MEKNYLSGFDLIFEKETNFEKIKKIFINYDCLSQLDWKPKGFITSHENGEKVQETRIFSEFKSIKISENFINKISQNNIIEKCKETKYGYVDCDCKKGTLKVDIENLIHNINDARLIELSVVNTVTIKVPKGKERKWKRNIQKKLGKNGSVDYEYRLINL